MYDNCDVNAFVRSACRLRLRRRQMQGCKNALSLILPIARPIALLKGNNTFNNRLCFRMKCLSTFWTCLTLVSFTSIIIIVFVIVKFIYSFHNLCLIIISHSTHKQHPCSSFSPTIHRGHHAVLSLNTLTPSTPH